MAGKENSTGFSRQQPEHLREFSSKSATLDTRGAGAAIRVRQDLGLQFAETIQFITLASQSYSSPVSAIA